MQLVRKEMKMKRGKSQKGSNTIRLMPNAADQEVAGPLLHVLVKKVATITDKQVGEAYTFALIDWMRREAAKSSGVKDQIEKAIRENSDLREEFAKHGVHLAAGGVRLA